MSSPARMCSPLETSLHTAAMAAIPLVKQKARSPPSSAASWKRGGEGGERQEEGHKLGGMPRYAFLPSQRAVVPHLRHCPCCFPPPLPSTHPRAVLEEQVESVDIRLFHTPYQLLQHGPSRSPCPLPPPPTHAPYLLLQHGPGRVAAACVVILTKRRRCITASGVQQVWMYNRCHKSVRRWLVIFRRR